MNRIVLLIAFLGGFHLKAQLPIAKVWTLDDCIQYALENNLNIRQSQLSVLQASNNLDAAKANLTPAVNGNVGYQFNFGLNIDPVTNIIGREQRQTGSIGLNTNWIVFDGFQNFNNIKSARLQKSVSSFELEAVKNDIALNVAQAYLQILLNYEISEIARQQLKISEEQRKRIVDLVAAGTVPRGNLYEADAQLARDQQNLISTNNEFEMSKFRLAILLQLNDFKGFEIFIPQLQLSESPYLTMAIEQIYDAARNEQPRLIANSFAVQKAQTDLSIAKGTRLPTLSLVAGISTNYSNMIPNVTGSNTVNLPIGVTQGGEPVFAPITQPVVEGIKPFGNQLGDNLNEFVGIGLQVPIWSRYQIRNQVRNAQINLLSNELNLATAENTLLQDIQRAQMDAIAALSNYRAAEKAVKSSQEAFNYAEERFRNGVINRVEFEQSRNGLAQAQSTLQQNKFDYIFKVKVLEFYAENQIKTF